MNRGTTNTCSTRTIRVVHSDFDELKFVGHAALPADGAVVEGDVPAADDLDGLVSFAGDEDAVSGLCVVERPGDGGRAIRIDVVRSVLSVEAPEDVGDDR